MSVSQTEDKDWINNWKEYFHQFYVDDLLVIPSWEEVKPEDQGKMILHIDPGTAFGTGMHETTQLCIRALRKFVTPCSRLLDVGCGSGILGILGLMFGAGFAAGTDLDICAIEATAQNKEANGIAEDDYQVYIGNLIIEESLRETVGYGYDLVTANILAEILVALTPVVVRHLKPGGIYITSGILTEKEDMVREAMEAVSIEVVEVCRQGEWISIIGRK